MKFSTACVVFAVFAAAAAPAQANSIVSKTVSTLSDSFLRLITTQRSIKKLEKQNYDFLSQALNNISSVLLQGLDSEIFKIGSGIRNTLVDVNLKVAQISGNTTSIISQIESVAHTVSTLRFNNARVDYDIKKNRIKKLCEDTLAKLNVVVQLIDETNEILARGVSGPLKMLHLTIQLTSDDRLVRERANIAHQQSIIDNPPSTWLFITDFDAVNTAEDLKRKGSVTIERINILVTSILDHTKWLENECQTIRKDLDNDRTTILVIESKISSASVSVNMVADGFDFLLTDSRNMSDNYLIEGSKVLVQLMSTLKDQVIKITRDRTSLSVGSYDYTTTELYRSTPEPVKLSWLGKTPVDGCFYIDNNRNTNCISLKTFEYMKAQYTWLSNKFVEFEALYKDNEKMWNDLRYQVFNVSESTLYMSEAYKFDAELKTKKLLWSDAIDKIRDLAVNLNSYAESLFLEANAQLNITRSNDDDTLNEDIKQFVDYIKITAVNIIKDIEKHQEIGFTHSPLFKA